MVQGDAYSLEVKINNGGVALDMTAVSLVEITLANRAKTYPGKVTYSDGVLHYPLTQEETLCLPPVCQMQVRVKFKGGNVIGSAIKQIDVLRALSKAVI